MQAEEAFILMFMVTAPTILVLATLLARSRGRIHEMERVLGISGRPSTRSRSNSESSGEVRIDQLENQVDHIASQMDRLAESQDFLSRVMSEKLDRLADGRMDTPH